MPTSLKELFKFVENFGYKPMRKAKTRKSSIDELLGKFKGAIPKGMTSTEYLKKLREKGYGKY